MMDRFRGFGLAALTVSAMGMGMACSSVKWDPAVIPESTLVPPPPVPGTAEPSLEGFDMDHDDNDSHTSLSLADKIKQFAPAVIDADRSKLPESEKAALDKIIEASKLLEPVFDRQAYAENPELAKKLTGNELAYFQIMRCPWDRQDHF